VIGQVAAASHGHRLETVSLGSGNCDLEVDLASRLIADVVTASHSLHHVVEFEHHQTLAMAHRSWPRRYASC